MSSAMKVPFGTITITETAKRLINESLESRRISSGRLVRQFEDPGRHREGRRILAQRFFYRPGTAAQRAAAVVYGALALEGPATRSLLDERRHTAPLPSAGPEGVLRTTGGTR